MRNFPKFVRIRSARRKVRGFSRPIWGQIAAGALSLLIAGGAIGLALLYAEISSDIPSAEALPSLLDPPDGRLLQPTRIFDRSGEHVLLTLANPLVGDRQYFRYPAIRVEKSQIMGFPVIPIPVINATLASAELKKDASGFLRIPFWQTGKILNIAERLASEVLLETGSTSKKQSLRVELLAAQILAAYGPEKVIEWYLNYADYGYMAYGVQAGSKLYFGKTCDRLSFSEAALLAAIAENPELDIRSQPERILARQREIIQAAVVDRIITPSEGLEAIQEIPVVTLPVDQKVDSIHFVLNQPISPAAVNFSLSQLIHSASPSLLKRGGFRVFTTLDYDLQTQVDCARSLQLNHLNSSEPAPSPTLLAGCQIEPMLPALPTETSLTPGGYSAEALILDSASGQILALSAGEIKKMDNFSPEDFRLPEHPIGTLGNLFVYLASFSQGQGPASLVWDIPSNGLGVVPSDEETFHGPVRMRIALVNDYSAAVESTLSQVGIENVWLLAKHFGIQSPEPVSKGDQKIDNLFRPIDILEISHALSILSNQGTLAGQPNSLSILDVETDNVNSTLKPSILLKITNPDGSALVDWTRPQTRSILSPQLAFLMTNVLSDQTARWPSLGHPNSLEIGRPAAAKYSKTTDGKNHWAIGYSKHLFFTTWIGLEESVKDLAKEDPFILQVTSIGLWHAIARYASQDLPNVDFPKPEGISFVQVCDPSGLLPTAACPNVVDEVFLEGREPVRLDTLYRLASIDRNTGNLATVFTPPDQVEQRLYFVPPEEAKPWIMKTGLEIQPETYDPLPDLSGTSKDARILSPASFQYLKGRVPIIGTASGSTFSFYRLQFGPGLYPEKWFLLGSDFSKAVVDGELLKWDTAGLDGLYAIQLLVVDQQRFVKRATQLVIIDNQAPQVQILNPADGEIVTFNQRKKIVLQTNITDNLAVEKVLFEVDGKKLVELKESPYAVSWTLVTGQHVLRVIAWDKAGNSTEAILAYQVK